MNAVKEEPLVVDDYTPNSHREPGSPSSSSSSLYDSSSSDDSSDSNKDEGPAVLDHIPAPELDQIQNVPVENPSLVKILQPEEQQLLQSDSLLVTPKEDNKSELAKKIYSLSNGGSQFSASLETEELWKRFDDIGTEMIVTRRGRRMFPPIKVQLADLNPKACYVLLMDMSPCDKYRYKYQNSTWQKCFEEECSPTRLYIHPDSPALGSHWMKSTISFYKLKLTNNQLDKLGNIIVNSMHKYQPRLHIVETMDVKNLKWEDFSTVIFPRTQYMTVTAYQNDKITQLKIDNNPFAKGFRLPFSRCRQRTRFQADQQRYVLGSTGSDSSVDESSNTTQLPGRSVIHTGPSFVPVTTMKEQGSRKRLYSMEMDGSEAEKHIRLSSPSAENKIRSISPTVTNAVKSGHPVLISTPEFSRISPFVFTTNKHAAEKKTSNHRASKLANGSAFSGNGISVMQAGENVLQGGVTTLVQADPTSGQSVHVPTVIHPNGPTHFVVNSLLPERSSPVQLPNGVNVNGLNGVTNILRSPTVMNGQAYVQGHLPMLNGLKHAMVVQADGQPPTLVPVSSSPNNVVYTSAPTQLISTTPVSSLKLSKTFSVKTETPTVSSSSVKSSPPPLVSISAASPPPTSVHKSSFVCESSLSLSEKHPNNRKLFFPEKSQNGLASSSFQKLVILPVMMNPISGQQDSMGGVLVPVDGSTTAVTSSIPTVINGSLSSSLIPEGYDEQVLSSMPIYRFGHTLNGMHPIQFVTTTHLPASAKKIELS